MPTTIARRRVRLSSAADARELQNGRSISAHSLHVNARRDLRPPCSLMCEEGIGDPFCRRRSLPTGDRGRSSGARSDRVDGVIDGGDARWRIRSRRDCARCAFRRTRGKCSWTFALHRVHPVPMWPAPHARDSAARHRRYGGWCGLAGTPRALTVGEKRCRQRPFDEYLATARRSPPSAELAPPI